MTADIGGHHQQVAVGEVDEAQDAVDHGVADGDEGVETAQGQAVDQLLQEGEEIHGGIILKILGIWPEDRPPDGFFNLTKKAVKS